MAARDYVVFFLNGERTEVRGEIAGMMFADYLRYKRGLTGTKIVCAEGDCGACTILHKFPLSDSYFKPINSCIATVAQMDGAQILSIEFLNRDPVQTAMLHCHGSQCGFCTPGFVMALKGCVEKKKASHADRLTEKEAKNALTGNLCRCTGYRQILDAALSLPLQEMESLSRQDWCKKADKILVREVKTPFAIETETFSMDAPVSLKKAVQALSLYKNTRLIAAGTDLGVQINKGRTVLPRLLSLHLIPELYTIKKVGNRQEGFRLRVGARVTLEMLRKSCEHFIPQFGKYLDLFASPQIKNAATLVGNIANASPIGDTLPFLLAMNARKQVVSVRGERWISLSKFFLGYRSTALKKDELISFVEFDLPAPEEDLYLLKTSQRKDLDISSVNGAIRFSPRFTRVALGGMAAVPFRLEKLEKFLQERRNSAECASQAALLLQKEVAPLSDLRGTQAFRRFLAEGFLKQSLADYQSKRGKSALPA